jgi:hypothetical protein
MMVSIRDRELLRYRGRVTSRLRHGGVRYATVAVVFVVSAALWSALLDARPWTSSPDAFDIVSWQLAAVPGKWLYALGTPLRDDPPAEESLARYFALDDRDSPEAQQLEGAAESVIEGRLDDALQDLGLPGVPGLSVWPPVDIELTAPPRLLAVSPRERIQLLSRTMLRPGLDLAQAIAIEERAAAVDDRSTVVLPLGGLSTYPAIVTDDAAYAETMKAAAHEWIHHYLAFHPLGWNTLFSEDTLRINETVADLAGEEIATVTLRRSGTPSTPATSLETDASRASAQEARLKDRDSTLRALRIEVDALLEQGRIDEAEQRMEQARLELAARGVNIRRLNQAYFAWTGTYAARGDSIDVLGGQLREMRQRAGSLRRFLEVVRSVTSRADVARILDELRATEGQR